MQDYDDADVLSVETLVSGPKLGLHAAVFSSEGLLSAVTDEAAVCRTKMTWTCSTWNQDPGCACCTCSCL